MLLGVLRMPISCWSGSSIDQQQRHSRYLEAADRIEDLEERLEALSNIDKEKLLLEMEVMTLRSDNAKLLGGIFPEHRAREVAGVWVGTHKIVEIDEIG